MLKSQENSPRRQGLSTTVEEEKSRQELLELTPWFFPPMAHADFTWLLDIAILGVYMFYIGENVKVSNKDYSISHDLAIKTRIEQQQTWELNWVYPFRIKARYPCSWEKQQVLNRIFDWRIVHCQIWLFGYVNQGLPQEDPMVDSI